MLFDDSCINNYIQDVLVSEKAGAHLVIVTRGGQDTLSLTDEKRIKEFIQYYQVCTIFDTCKKIFLEDLKLSAKLHR